MSVKTYNSWSICDDCGFQGLIEFRCRADEDYSDDDALGYMMDTHCPSCEEVQAVLVVVDEYREMEFIARQNGSDS